LTRRKYDPAIIAERLKQLRKERGITQADLADGVGIGLSTVKQYESKKRIPEKYNLTLLANYFGVLESWITGESNHKTIFEKMDAELGEDKLSELRNQVQYLSWLEKEFDDFHCENYTAEQLERFDSEVRNFIRFKIDQMNKENGF
jgi:transcriptional regulator with XRE-family HTH domain